MPTYLSVPRCVLLAAVMTACFASRAGAGMILALNPQASASFYVHGLGTLDVGSGIIQVNSSAPDAVVFQGLAPKVFARSVNIVGGYKAISTSTLPTQINVSEPSVADPLADLPAPLAPSQPVGTKISGGGTFLPGYYPQGLDLGSGSDVTLMPGVYVLDNGFTISGNASLQGRGVLFYIRSGAILDSGGTAHASLTPPAAGVYQGITFFQARDNPNPATFGGLTTYTGVGEAPGIGTLYFPAAGLKLGGGGDLYVNGVIADSVETFGTGRITIVPEPSTFGLLLLLLLPGARLTGTTPSKRRRRDEKHRDGGRRCYS